MHTDYRYRIVQYVESPFFKHSVRITDNLALPAYRQVTGRERSGVSVTAGICEPDQACKHAWFLLKSPDGVVLYRMRISHHTRTVHTTYVYLCV